MQDILDPFFNKLTERSVDLPQERKDELLMLLRHVYKRMEGNLLDRKVLPLVDDDTPNENNNKDEA